MRLNHVAQCPQGKSLLYHIGRGLLADKKYLGLGGKLADSSSRFDSVQGRKPDVEHNQVRSQFFGFVNRF